MWQRISRFLDVSARYLNWVPLLTGGGVVTFCGGMSAWLAAQTAWGYIVWAIRVVASWISWFADWHSTFCGFAVARAQLAKASAVRQWAKAVDTVNPLESEFTKKRINILDLVNPVTDMIENKRFIDCELFGPANLGMINSSMSDVNFGNCDLIMLKPGPAITYTVKRLVNVKIIGGSIFNCTLFVKRDGVAALQAGGIKPYFISLTGINEIDSQEKPTFSNK